MEKSNIDKAKDIFVYAPVGAFGFIRDNAPTFYSMFVSRGRKEITKTSIVAEERISHTKNHGQIIAMGSDIAKDKGAKVTYEAKEKGENIVHTAAEIATDVFHAGSDVVLGFISQIVPDAKTGDSQEEPPEAAEAAKPAESAEVAEPTHGVINEAKVVEKEEVVTLNDEAGSSMPPIDSYETLSAPEIIDRLDQLSVEELHAIIKYELSFRNRQTIIHAVNHRLLTLN